MKSGLGPDNPGLLLVGRANSLEDQGVENVGDWFAYQNNRVDYQGKYGSPFPSSPSFSDTFIKNLGDFLTFSAFIDGDIQLPDPVTGLEPPTELDSSLLTREPTPAGCPPTVCGVGESLEWFSLGAPTTQPEMNGLFPNTIALSHPLAEEREVTMFGTEGLDGLGF